MDDTGDLVAFCAQRPRTRWAGHPMVFENATESTNDDARAAAIAGVRHGYAVIADTQRSGRGRRGRTWHSPPGENLYVSIVTRPRLAPSAAPVLALAAALAVHDAVASVVDSARVTIKWPNDVRVDGRKVAGVLVEGSLRGDSLAFAIVGIGLNVRGDALPGELADRATTLRLARGGDVSRARVLEALLDAFESRLECFEHHGAAPIVDAVRARCDTIGTRVRVDDVEGVAEGIDDSGALAVRTDAGDVVNVRAGEVIESERRA